MTRAYNFSAGPAMLPTEVLEQAREELLEWDDAGGSVMELSHRGDVFKQIAAESEADLRELLGVPDNYKVLFLQGGAALQFAMAPMNLAAGGGKADYILTGNWGKKAVKEAKTVADARVAATSEEQSFTRIPPREQWDLRGDAAYVHYTPNETIQGVEFHEIPDVGDAPLVADMSSTILSRPIDVSKFGVIYAGAQKNIGPAGLTIVIVREDLLERSPGDLPSMLSYKVQADKGSMFNTPPTYTWYMAGLVFKWLKRQGGLEAMAERNRKKAELLYQFIDDSSFYSNPVAPEARSRMNVPFLLADDSLNASFLAEAEEAGLITLKGHRDVGGMRASLYNAMPLEGVQALVDFMRDFEKRRG